MSTVKSSNGKYKLVNSLTIPVRSLPDERISYFEDFTIPVDLKGYNQVKIRALNHITFPNVLFIRNGRKKVMDLF